MDLNFWRRLWDNNEIGFHQSNVNGLLADYFHMLSLPQNSRIFAPGVVKSKILLGCCRKVTVLSALS